LGVAEVEFGGEFHAVLDAEVLLSLEALLQSVELVVGERRPCLACLLRLAAGAASTSSTVMRQWLTTSTAVRLTVTRPARTTI